jgi:plastocyanin
MRAITFIVAGGLVALAAGPLAGQSVVTRTPSLNGAWLPPRGTVQFNFIHRFHRGDAPEHRISNSPTFLTAVRAPFLPAMVGAVYASNSDVVARMPNEWEFFVRAAPLPAGNPVADLSLHVGYNLGARSVDAELGLARAVGPLQLLATGRTFTNAFDGDETRQALAGGVALRLTRRVTLAGDVATLLERGDAERVAWSAGLHVGVPGTPHSLSMHVTNIATNTLEGASRGSPRVRVGFEYTVPISLARYGRRTAPRRDADSAAALGAAAGRDTVFARIRDFSFGQTTLEIAAGTTVVFTNEDDVPHTVTAADGRSFDSGPLSRGERWSIRFDQAGSYAFRCEPHPFMRATVVVR